MHFDTCLSAAGPVALWLQGKVAPDWPECPPVGYPYGLCVFSHKD